MAKIEVGYLSEVRNLSGYYGRNGQSGVFDCKKVGKIRPSKIRFAATTLLTETPCKALKLPKVDWDDL